MTIPSLPTQVMVPQHFERDWENALFFHERGINVTLKPQSDPTASRVVDGYKEEDPKRFPGTECLKEYPQKVKKSLWLKRPRSGRYPGVEGKNDARIWHMQVELKDLNGKKWYMDQAERFNVPLAIIFKDGGVTSVLAD